MSAAPGDEIDIVGQRLHAESVVEIRTRPWTGTPLFLKVHAAGLHLHKALNDGEDPVTGQITLYNKRLFFSECQPGWQNQHMHCIYIITIYGAPSHMSPERLQRHKDMLILSLIHI